MNNFEQDLQEYKSLKKQKYKTLNQISIDFFSTNDNFFKLMDIETVLKYIRFQYPNLNLLNSDIIIKKTITEILNNPVFVKQVLKYFNITFFEFIKCFYKDYSSIFNGSFIKKIKNLIQVNGYKY